MTPCRVAAAGGKEDIAQVLIGLRIAGGEPAAGCAQEIAGGEHDVAGRVGVNDAPVRIDQEHAGAETVERVGEGRGFGGLEVDQPADQDRAAV